MSAPVPALAILVANWNTAALIERCVRSIQENVRVPFELVVVDNGSADGSVEALRRLAAGDPRLRLLTNPRNYGYAHANNQAFAHSTAPWLALVNSDIVVRPGALEEILDYARNHPRVGITSCMLVGEDGRAQHFHRRFPDLLTVMFWFNRRGRRIDRLLFGSHFRKRYFMTRVEVREPIAVDQAGGACMVLSRRVIAAAGGLFDEAFPLFFNDVDLSRRVRGIGLEIHVLPVALDHGGGRSILLMGEEEKLYHRRLGLAAYYAKHGTPWQRRLVRVLVGPVGPPPAAPLLVPPSDPAAGPVA